jgi:hypothetical protein
MRGKRRVEVEQEPKAVEVDTYSPRAIQEFVLRLGCNTYADPDSLICRRDPRDYRELLLKCVEIYGRRKDKMGELHVLYAKRELSLLK